MPKNKIQDSRFKIQKKEPASQGFLNLKSLIFNLQSQKGQTLLDIVIATGVFLILIHALFSLVTVIYETMGFTRTRLSARHLANEKMELLANLPYDDLGTTTGIPNGAIPEYESVIRNGLNYQVHTTIVYVDDSFDGTVPADLLPTDYKRTRVEVTWEGQYSSRALPVVIVSDLAPKGVETSVGGGTLSVFVINAQAVPVSGAQVHIVNSTVIPTVDITLQSNVDGRVLLPGAPACASCYEITVTKATYTTDRTYSTSEVTNPNKRHITIAEGQLSDTTFVIDKTTTLTITSKQSQGSTFGLLPNSTFRLTGAKTIGTDSQDDPVYKFDQTLTTNSSGTYVFTDLEWDNYILTIPATEDKDIVGTNPLQPLAVNPDQTLAFEYAVADHSTHSLLLSVENASGSAIASASALLKLLPSFEASGSTGLATDPDFGQIFFGDLSAATYDFIVSHTNFATKSGTIQVNGNTSDTVIME